MFLGGDFFKTKRLFFITASYSLGILVLVNNPVFPPALSISLFLALLLSLCLHREMKLLLISILCFAISLLITHEFLSDFKDIPKDNAKIEGQFRVTADAKVGDKSLMATIESKDNVRLVLGIFKKTQLSIKEGDLLHIRGIFKVPARARNPGQFDYKDYLKTQGVIGIVFVEHSEIIGEESPFILKRWALKIRKNLREDFDSLSNTEYRDMLWSMSFGLYGSKLSTEDKDRFKSLGLSHLLVASGSQVNLLTGGLLSIFRVCMFPQRLQYPLIILSHLLLLVITGGDVAILRSILMSQLLLGLAQLQRHSSILLIWVGSFLLLLFFNPLNILNIGAQLSVMAGLSMIVLVPLFADALPRHWAPWLRELLSLAVVPSLMTFPLIWYHFSEFSWMAIPSNFIILPLVDFVVILGVIGAFLSFFSWPLAFLLLSTATGFVIFIQKVVLFLAQVPYPVISLKKPSIWVIFLLYGGIFYSILGLEEKKLSRLKWGFSLSGLLLISLLLFGAIPNKTLKLYFLDVDQGDCIVIQSPRKKIIIIDAGKRVTDFRTGKIKVDMGKKVVLPFCRYLGVNRIDALMISHYDADHSGGMGALLEKIPVTTTWDNGDRRSGEFRRLHEITKTMGQDPEQFFYRPPAGTRIELEKDLFLEVLAPLPMTESLSSNNRSLVLRLVYKEFSVLLTGDIEEETEALLGTYYGDRLRSTVLKVGHHGSKTSSTPFFLHAVNPELAIIQLGRQNAYRHPSQSVIKRFDDFGIPVLRTDQKGAIILESDGKGYWVEGDGLVQ